MSVPVYRRSENKLEAYKLTMTMIKYTLQMVENEKIFPKKSRWNLCSRIMDTCLDSAIKITQSNKIQPKNIEDAKRRLELQNDVIMNFEALWCLMTIAYESYSIPSHKIEVWCNSLLDAEDKTTAWHKSDMKRFKEMYNL